MFSPAYAYHMCVDLCGCVRVPVCGLPLYFAFIILRLLGSRQKCRNTGIRQTMRPCPAPPLPAHLDLRHLRPPTTAPGNPDPWKAPGKPPNLS